jgi:hypothetical protein
MICLVNGFGRTSVVCRFCGLYELCVGQCIWMHGLVRFRFCDGNVFGCMVLVNECFGIWYVW